jgi:hypothetical protein
LGEVERKAWKGRDCPGGAEYNTVLPDTQLLQIKPNIIGRKIASSWSLLFFLRTLGSSYSDR